MSMLASINTHRAVATLAFVCSRSCFLFSQHRNLSRSGALMSIFWSLRYFREVFLARCVYIAALKRISIRRGRRKLTAVGLVGRMTGVVQYN